MGTAGFDKLLAWQQARALTRDIYSVTRSETFDDDRELARLLRRASTSIMTSIAEGHGRHNHAEFCAHLATTCAASAATRSYVYIAWDAGYLTESAAKRLLEQTESVGALTDGLRIAMSDRATRDTLHG